MPWYAPAFGQWPHWANAGSTLEKSFLSMGWVETDGTIPTPGVPPDPAAARLVKAINGKQADGNGALTLVAADVGAVAVGDPQLTNPRTPKPHAASHATDDSDPITPASIGAVATTSRRSTHTFCAAGDNGTTAAGRWNARYAVRLPVTPTRFRLRIANYDVRDAGADATVATPLASVWIGAHALGPLGELTGKMSGSPVNLGVTGTIPADGSYLTSAWITDPAALALLATGKHAVLSLGVNADGTARTAVRGWNRSWIAFSSDSAGVLAPGDLGQYNYTLYDAQVEYEYAAPGSTSPVVLCVGDSLTSGYSNTASGTGPSVWSYPAQLGQRAGVAPINLGMFGSTTGLWVNPNGSFWTRADIASYAPDAAVVHLGSNNAAASNALSAYQSDMVAIVGNVRAFASVKRVFACTVPPRNFPTGTIPTGGDVAAGVSSITSSISIASGLIAIDSGATAETATVTAVSGTGPYTLTLSTATTKAHSAGALILGTSETCRTQYNDWLRSMPLGLSGVVDLDLLLRDPANVRVLRAEYDCGDGIHLTALGYGEVAGAAARAVTVV